MEKLCGIFLLDSVEEASEITGDDIVMRKAVRTLEELSKDENIIGLYDAEEVEKKVWNTKLLYAEKIGKEKGKKDNQIEIAKKMLKIGLLKEQILEVTGLTEEELKLLM